MANKTLASYAEQKLEEARRDLGLAAMDFSIPDEKILEIRASVREAAQDVQKMKKKKGLLGFLGL